MCIDKIFLFKKILHFLYLLSSLLLSLTSNNSQSCSTGFLGSMYSFLQFLGSPIIGALSDIYGRKPLMLLCLTGISLSYLLWCLSTNFGIFVLARFVGGISKGNISLSMAIISDVTSPKTRGKAMVKKLLNNAPVHDLSLTCYILSSYCLLKWHSNFTGTCRNSLLHRLRSGTNDRGVLCVDLKRQQGRHMVRDASLVRATACLKRLIVCCSLPEGESTDETQSNHPGKRPVRGNLLHQSHGSLSI